MKEFFEGNEALSTGLYIHDWHDWSQRHPVVRLSFGRGTFQEPHLLEANVMEQLAAIERRAGLKTHTASGRFAAVLEALHDQTGQPVTVLVDEYDKPILSATTPPSTAPAANRSSGSALSSAAKPATSPPSTPATPDARLN